MSTRVEATTISFTEHDFGVTDPKGRRLGARLLITAEDFEQGPPGAGGFTLPPGRHYAYLFTPCRGGRSFGTSTLKYADSLEACQQAAAERLARARRKANLTINKAHKKE